MRCLIISAVFCTVNLYGQAPVEVRGVPARAGAVDYQAKAEVGGVTIAADFLGHAVPTPEGMFTNEEYVVVEVAFYGKPDAKLKLSWDDFSLRINGKKMPTPASQFGLALKSLKDPEWQPPVSPDGEKSKGSINGGGSATDPKPLPPKMPFPLRRAMELKVTKAVMAEGERGLPQAGLVFFQYRGKDEGIRQLELIYTGAAGMATLIFER
jgi:hypothetical protein